MSNDDDVAMLQRSYFALVPSLLALSGNPSISIRKSKEVSRRDEVKAVEPRARIYFSMQCIGGHASVVLSTFHAILLSITSSRLVKWQGGEGKKCITPLAQKYLRRKAGPKVIQSY